MSTLKMFIFGTLLALLFSLPAYIRDRRLARVARAKLAIASAVTEMDRLMLAGKITLGEACHDHLYQSMLRMEYSRKKYFPWKLWRLPSSESIALHKKIHKELSEKGEIAKLFHQCASANFALLRNGQPFVAIVFILWVLLFCGGLLAIFTAFVSFIKLKTVSREKVRQLFEEWCVLLNSAPTPQFRVRA